MIGDLKRVSFFLISTNGLFRIAEQKHIIKAQENKGWHMIDQIKTGQLIAKKRKEQGLTQSVLAEKLGLTDRAVSKWERGLSLPDASIMLRLCSILRLTVNELLSGEEMEKEEDYKAQAEKLILEMKRHEEEHNRYLLKLETVLEVLSTIAALTIIFTASFLVPGKPLLALLMIIASAILFTGIYFALKIEHDAGYYECKFCHYRYIPSFSSVFMAPHIGRKRYMRCPKCGRKSYMKKVLSADEEKDQP